VLWYAGIIAANWKNDLDDIRVDVLHTRSRDVANSGTFIAPLKTATGVWISGWRQWRLADAYLGTRVQEELFWVLSRGGVIGGSSAGATIQGLYLIRGGTKANTIIMGGHEKGFGFVTNVAIDQHLFARNRQFDMFELLPHRPELLGTGLDEGAAILVQGNSFEVMTNRYVVVYDGTRFSAERDTTYHLTPGSNEFYVLHKGQQYDLKKRRIMIREVIIIANRKFPVKIFSLRLIHHSTFIIKN